MPPPSPPQPPATPSRRQVWSAPGAHEAKVVADMLRQETVGGALLLATGVIALVWANSPWGDAYTSFIHFELGPLTIEHWAAEAGLAIFFFIAGLELKRELTVGSLANPADALVPVSAALGGMVVPACIYLAVNAVSPSGDLGGWAVPMATDIAFALAVLAVVGRSLPASLRAFLLTLAVVDDLGAILVIAFVFTSSIALLPLAGAAALLFLYAVLQRSRVVGWPIYVPLAVACWWLVYEGGIHATIAGVALGLLTRVRPDQHEVDSPAERLDHQLRPLSAGLIVPFFALTSAGVAVTTTGIDMLSDPIFIGIALGLFVGKSIGVLAGAWLVTAATRAELADDIVWRDVVGIATLSGVGFTVSLLIAELAFDDVQTEAAKAAVLTGSLVSGLVAAVILRRRNAHHRSRDRG